MRETEAKIKWCPFSRVLKLTESFDHIAMTAINRSSNGQVMSRAKCLGSSCACWVIDYNERNGQGHCGLTK
jgi:hypothetical protein